MCTALKYLHGYKLSYGTCIVFMGFFNIITSLRKLFFSRQLKIRIFVIALALLSVGDKFFNCKNCICMLTLTLVTDVDGLCCSN